MSAVLLLATVPGVLGLEHPGAPTFSFEERRAGTGVLTAIAQDTSGRVFVAGHGGVFRFDGLRMTRFDDESPHGLPAGAANAFCLAAADGDELWAGWSSLALDEAQPGRAGPVYETGSIPGLGHWHDGAWHDVPLPEGLEGLHVWALAPAGAGLWIGSDRGLFLAERRDGRPLALRLVHAGDGVSAILALPDRVYAGSARGLLVGTPRDGRWHFTATGVSGRVHRLARGHDGRVLVATHAGLVVLARDGATPAQTQLQGKPVRALAVAPDGAVWAGGDDGLWRGEDENWQVLRPAGARAPVAVSALAIDRDGTVWAGTRAGGVFLARPSGEVLLDEQAGLPARAVRALIGDGDGGLWVSTVAGLAHARAGRARPVALPEDAVAGSLARDEGGRVWAALGRAGLARLPSAPDREPIEIVPLPASILGAARTVVAHANQLFVIDDAGRVAVLAMPERIGPRRAAPLLRTIAQDELCGAPATQIAPRRAGGVWVGDADGGLGRITSELAPGCELPAADGAEARAPVATVLEDTRGRVFAGLLRARGLLFRDGVASGRATERDGLPCQSIQALTEDPDGGLWIGCGAGITQLNRAETDSLVARRTIAPTPLLSPRHTLPSADVQSGLQPTAYLDRDSDRVWFATDRGAFGVRRDVFAPRGRRPPPLRLAELRIDGVSRPPLPTAHATLPRSIELQFELPGTAIQGVPGVHLRVDGRDRQDVVLPEGGLLRLGALAPGEYVLRARVDWPVRGWPRETEVLRLTISPPLAAQPRTWAAAALALVALTLGLHRLRQGRSRRRQAEREAERARMARDLHDGLGQMFAALSFQFEAMRRRLTTGDVSGTRGVLDDASRVLQEGHARSRETIWSLRGQARDPEDLTAGVRRAVANAARAARAARTRVRLRVRDLRPREGRHRGMPALAATEIPAMVTEMLSNALAHARARAIQVDLLLAPDSLELEVRDDGVGFAGSPEAFAAAGRLGLLGLRERAARLSGRLDLETAPGRGTRWRLVVDLSPAAPMPRRRDDTP